MVERVGVTTCHTPTRKPNVKRCPNVFDARRALLSRRGVPAGHRTELSADRGADAHDVASSLSFHCPLDGRAGDAEQVGELRGAVIAAIGQVPPGALLAVD
jgi:hypothetical protein